MPKLRICPDCGDMHDMYDWPGNHRMPNEVLCAPSVVRDSMPLTEHVDGKFYDSKRGFRKITREKGYIEVGDDPNRKKPLERKPDKEGIFKALKQAKEMAGDAPKKKRKRKAA